MIVEKLDRLLDEFGQQLVEEMKTRLKGHGKVATGELLNSIGYELINSSPEVSTLSFFMADYGTFVDKGRKPGKMPPISKIQQWCSVKGIPKKAAFPIARKIAVFGIPATNFFTIPLTRNVKRIRDKVEKLTAETITLEIKNNFK